MDDIKPILKEYTEEVKRHIDVLRKGSDNKFQKIIEKYGLIDKKLNSRDKKDGSC